MEDTRNAHASRPSEFSCSGIVKFRRRKGAQLQAAPYCASRHRRPVHSSDYEHFPVFQQRRRVTLPAGQHAARWGESVSCSFQTTDNAKAQND